MCCISTLWLQVTARHLTDGSQTPQSTYKFKLLVKDGARGIDLTIFDSNVIFTT